MLPTYTRSSPHQHQNFRSHRHISRGLVIILLLSFCFIPKLLQGSLPRSAPKPGDICTQEAPLNPKENSAIAASLAGLYDTPKFKERAVEWLAGAVKIPTETFEDMGEIGKDGRWDSLAKFHSYLRTAFPKVHASLNLTKVNTYGLVYHWQGSDDSLKPILLAAHQDVVPVDPSTASEWIHPPYSGHFDGEFIWGRGCADDKSGVIGMLSSLEGLLENEFKPTRSLVLALGFDEEISGFFGAHKISEYLLEKYAKDGFAFLIDEGGSYTQEEGVAFATPGVTEKGAMDVRITVSAPGGHSSIPPPHTSIGLLSLMIARIESHPHMPSITRSSPIYSGLQCRAAHDPALSGPLRADIQKSLHSQKALKRVEETLFNGPQGKSLKALFGTTQAADMIEGGIKSNALPERASAVVNHRLDIHSSSSAIIDHLTKVLMPLAKHFDLAFSAGGVNITSPANPAGALVISDAFGRTFEPAPITPTNAAPYKLLSGTIRAAYANGRGRTSGNEMIVAPGMAAGNTDTRHYWALTQHIFRYKHLAAADLFHEIHTTNEALKAEGFVESIRFFTTLILNADESKEF
ncbi:hypothetical protein BOTBODRAFT_108726 [Botryobasidium botryosum FD-172 SS1]|uniref:Peptidase M20 dimerisation domain-containing protein n=1 Tax=Botryobasidium botryosum (strain FD-172 SS1) TaxID=930990 RepID=A0A067MIB5_BOTB1|nr:hypothetical protein BOTBODRAFT_108726 [Botryobasidium botryosum FD-172 SS1]